MSSLPKRRRPESRRPLGVDLFAGAGGLSLGFEQAGFNVVASVEVDPVHCAVHEFNFPNCTSICADVSKITGREIRKKAKLGDARIDVVFGGPPCQGFSLIGKRALDDPRNGLLLEFMRLVVELDADYFVFENVKGLTIGNHRRLLQELIDAFARKGYEVALPYRVLNAADFGVPQNRARVFLMGAKKGLTLPIYPDGKVRRTTVWEAIGDLPNVDQFAELIESDTVEKVRFGRASAYVRVLRGMSDDADDFSHPRVWSEKSLTSSMRTVHTPLSRSRFSATPQGEVETVSRFHRLHPEGLCNTLRAGTGHDRGSFTSPRPIHPHEPRVLTVREAARLHSYPDWFRPHQTKWHGFRQIGNSVPPLLARAVAIQVISAMRCKPAKPAERLKLGSERLLSFNLSTAGEYYGLSTNVAKDRTELNGTL